MIPFSTTAVMGNRCGHVPSMPREFNPPVRHRTRPDILVKLISSVRDYYDCPASTIPSLNLANGSERKQRSERRESCLAVLCAILHYTDLPTLRVGVPQTNGTLQGITMDFIADRCSIGLRRTERALADLVAAGLITVFPLTEKIAEGIYKGRAAIRTVNKSLFALFGLSKRLKWERKKAVARRRKVNRKDHEKAQAKIDLLTKSVERKRLKKDEDKSSEALPEVAEPIGSETLSPQKRAFFDMKKILDSP